MGFSVTLDDVSFESVVSDMSGFGASFSEVGIASITSVSEQVKDRVVSDTSQILNVDEGRIDGEIVVEQSGGDSLDGFSAVIRSQGEPIELIDLTDGTVPIYVQIYQGGSVHEFRHAFIRQGHIYDRESWGKGSPRYPIHVLQTIRVQDVQDKSDFIDPVIEDGADSFLDEYGGAIDEVFSNA